MKKAKKVVKKISKKIGEKPKLVLPKDEVTEQSSISWGDSPSR